MGFKKFLGCVLIVSTLTGCAAHNLHIVDREIIEQTLLAFLDMIFYRFPVVRSYLAVQIGRQFILDLSTFHGIFPFFTIN